MARRCKVRWYKQNKGARMFTPIKGKTQANKLLGTESATRLQYRACDKGMGVASCRKDRPCFKVFAYRQ